MSFGGKMGSMPSVMKHDFSMVPQAEIPRSSFDRSHGHKTTFDSGYLVPIFYDEALPGDTMSLNMSSFCRLSTPIKPVMDNLYMDVFFFAVPLRLLWTNFKKFMGEQTNPGDSVSYLVPKIVSPAGGPAVGSISDYFGLPTVGQVGGGNTITFNAFHHRAYNLIYNEWFRDQNLQNSVTINTGDGPDTYTDYTLLRRGKRHDYFTSALPWPQKGTAVSIPLGTSAPVIGIGKGNANFNSGVASNVRESTGSQATYAASRAISEGSADATFYVEQNPSATGYPNIRADLSNATAATINALRLAFQVQRLLERDARGGTRYTEIIRSHFGVTSPDSRLQRPEYLGGGSTQINFHPIPQTGGTGASGTTTAQGSLAAFATQSTSGKGFTKSFTEHMVLLGLASVRADLNYQQGMNRMWNRQTRYDYYWPALSHIGEQTILNKEIFCDGSASDSLVFGYQERYAEYRDKPSVITGKFRSTASGTLDIWHTAQKFTALPTLGDTFIKDTPPIDRIVAVNTEPQLLADFYFNYKCARPIPLYGVPGNIDRF